MMVNDLFLTVTSLHKTASTSTQQRHIFRDVSVIALILMAHLE